MSALSIKLFSQELNFLKNIFRRHDTSSHDITADDMEMKSLQEDDAELDTGQDALTLDEFVLNPPGYIPTPPLDSGQQTPPSPEASLYSSHIQPSQASPDTRTKDDDKGQFNNFYIGDDGPSNTFSSCNSPQPQRVDIQCVSEITLHLPTNKAFHTLALLDTGSTLNFVSKELIQKLGSPEKEGNWSGKIKTISGAGDLTTPFYNIAIRDTKNGVNIIKALMVDSIGNQSNLDHEAFTQICQTLKVDPALIQQPNGKPLAPWP